MNDLAASLVISVSWVILAIGVAYGKDIVTSLWTLWIVKRREAKQEAEMAQGDTEMSRGIAEAMQAAEYAWLVWEPTSVEEESNDG